MCPIDCAIVVGSLNVGPVTRLITSVGRRQSLKLSDRLRSIRSRCIIEYSVGAFVSILCSALLFCLYIVYGLVSCDCVRSRPVSDFQIYN